MNWLKILLIIVFSIIIVGIIVYLIYRQIDLYTAGKEPKILELKDTFKGFFEGKRGKWKGSLESLNHRNIMNEVKLYKGNKSYTINKKKIFICLKDENDSYYSDNMLIYVLAHEFSHVIAKSIGHTKEFYDIFEELLVELADSGVYDPSKDIVKDYCEH